MIYRFFIGLLLLATALYYLFCFLQIFEVLKFTKHKIEVPKMFIPFYYLLKKDPEAVPEKPKRKKPTYTRPIKTPEDNEKE